MQVETTNFSGALAALSAHGATLVETNAGPKALILSFEDAPAHVRTYIGQVLRRNPEHGVNLILIALQRDQGESVTA